MKLDSNAGGVYVIAPTPFHPDGRIDDASVDRMTDFFVAAGADGMTVLGQLGEAPKMAHAEAEKGIKLFAKEVLPRLQEVPTVATPGAV